MEESGKQRCYIVVVVERNHTDFHGALDLKILLRKKILETEWVGLVVQYRQEEKKYYIILLDFGELNNRKAIG